MRFPRTQLIFFLKKYVLIKIKIQLQRKFIDNKSEENSKKYKQQRSYCINFLCKTKMEFFQNMDISKVNDSKMF